MSGRCFRDLLVDRVDSPGESGINWVFEDYNNDIALDIWQELDRTVNDQVKGPPSRQAFNKINKEGKK